MTEDSTTKEPALRILAVEDNPDHLFLVKDMLQEAEVGGEDGFELLHEDSLGGAIETLNEAQLDLVILDLTLPDSDRLATFQAVRGAAPDLPIVIHSGLEDEELALQAVREGAQDYLLKGEVDPSALGRAVRFAVERFRFTERFKTSHERFRQTLEESDAAQLVLSREGRILYANSAAESTLRREAAQILGQTLRPEISGPVESELTLADGARGLLRARMAETIWEGRLGYLVTVAAFEVEGEPAVSLEPKAVSRFEGMRSASPAMRKLFATCDRIAPTPASVLLLGETGTGKELLARAIHKRSGRKGRFVAVNCAAIPESLVESELFGHEKGAFTGASKSKQGLFRQAEGGTLLLDEIGSLDMSAQLSLLRTLQERTVRPVGSSREVAVDVRVVAATSIPLFDAVREGTFREDLVYRLDVIRFEVPPLRERPEDVLHLFRHFCVELGERYELESPDVGPGFLEAMLGYVWPGNVRQLENFTERLLLTCQSDSLTGRQFHDLVRPYRPPPPGSLVEGPPRDRVDLSLPLGEFLDRQEHAYVEALMGETHGRIQEAAERANVNRRTMLRKLRKHGLDKADYR